MGVFGFLLVISVVLGFVFGFFLNFPTITAITAVALFLGVWSLWHTRNWELGSLIGVFNMAICIIGVLVMWVTTVIVRLATGTLALDFNFLGWFLR